MEQDLSEPVLDERLFMPGLTGSPAQVLFPDGQRAQSAQPGLDDDKCNGSQMGQPEPEMPDPRPAPPPAQQNQRLTTNDKGDDQAMDEQDRIGQQAGGRHALIPGNRFEQHRLHDSGLFMNQSTATTNNPG